MTQSQRQLLSFTLFLAIGLVFLNGCGNSDNFVFTNTSNPAAPPTPPEVLPPIANNDTISTIGNSTLSQTSSNGVLVNDSVNGATITAFDATSTQGGAVVLAADGSFTYTPPFGFEGADTFTYTLTNSDGSSTATVTMSVDSLGFFVDNTAAPGGNGSQSTPFDNLADGINAAGNGDTVFVYRGDGNSVNGVGPLILPPGVKLIGQGSGLIVTQTIEPAGLAPTLTGPIVMNGDNTLSGFIIDGDGEDAIQADGKSNLTVTNNTFLGNIRPHLEASDLGGTILISDNDFGPVDQDEGFIFLFSGSNTMLSANYTIRDNKFTDVGDFNPRNAIFVSVRDESVVSVTVTGNTITSDNNSVDSFRNAVELLSFGNAQLTATINDNIFNDVGGSAIFLQTLQSGTLTANISDNQITRPNERGIYADASGGEVTVRAVANQILNAGSHGFEMIVQDGVTGKAALRNNTLLDNSFSILFSGEDGSTSCADITGNRVNTDMRFDGATTGVINVERLDANTGGPLQAVNTFDNGSVSLGTGSINPVDAGFCQIP